jgi:hypothetical protein
MRKRILAVLTLISVPACSGPGNASQHHTDAQTGLGAIEIEPVP